MKLHIDRFGLLEPTWNFGLKAQVYPFVGLNAERKEIGSQAVVQWQIKKDMRRLIENNNNLARLFREG